MTRDAFYSRYNRDKNYRIRTYGSIENAEKQLVTHKLDPENEPVVQLLFGDVISQSIVSQMGMQANVLALEPIRKLYDLSDYELKMLWLAWRTYAYHETEKRRQLAQLQQVQDGRSKS